DSTLLAAAVDGTVLVVRHGETRKEHLEVARDMLAGVNARVLGVVLNGTPASGVGSDYYGGGYGADGGSYDVYYQAPRDAADAAAGTAGDASRR
ncbi:chain length determinant protein, partial [Micrococcus yunnanensis]|nr:chain length determinant protein [Micrococcus yunnanensis]